MSCTSLYLPPSQPKLWGIAESDSEILQGPPFILPKPTTFVGVTLYISIYFSFENYHGYNKLGGGTERQTLLVGCCFLVVAGKEKKSDEVKGRVGGGKGLFGWIKKKNTGWSLIIRINQNY